MNQAIALLNLTHLRFRGPDAERYLNGQVTQQVEEIALAHSRYTFVCDAKGRILFDGYIHRDQEGYLLSVEGADSEEVFTRMDRYLIADDCELTDESDRWGISHQITHPDDSQVKEGLINRFHQSGRDHYLEGVALSELQSIAESGPTSTELEDLRIKNGIARLPDLQGALPAETQLEESAVSFHKGCYLGQEVISRMKRAARTNRKLTPLSLSESANELPLNFASENSDKTMLEVTSCSSIQNEEGFFPALGYLSSKAEDLASLSTPTGIRAKL